jgi:hypothetical protein
LSWDEGRAQQPPPADGLPCKAAPDSSAKWKNLCREILNRGWHLSESWLQENKGSLRKLLQRLRGHGLLVPTVKKATP